jgi:hypothetical protein
MINQITKTKRIYIIFILGIIITGCDNRKLGDNYYWIPRDVAFDIGYPYGAVIYKSEHQSLIGDIIISRDVIEVNHSDNYIIAIQKIYRKDSIRFFIIEKTDATVYGPFNKSEFYQKKIELDLPRNLDFRQY